MSIDQNNIHCEEAKDRIETQLTTLREIYRNSGRRELVLQFIKFSPESERAILMEEFEHLEMMREGRVFSCEALPRGATKPFGAAQSAYTTLR